MKSTIAAAAIFVALAQGAVLRGPYKALGKRDTVSGVEHTFFGYPDNDPPSAEIAYDCGRGYTAGGSGTFDDPLTMATASGEFDQCEVIYDTYTHKYLRFEDDCDKCTSDYNDSGLLHIDIWTGDNSDGGQDQIDCEDQLTPEGGYDVIRNPGGNQTVNSAPLWDGSCHPENTYPNK